MISPSSTVYLGPLQHEGPSRRLPTARVHSLAPDFLISSLHWAHSSSISWYCVTLWAHRLSFRRTTWPAHVPPGGILTHNLRNRSLVRSFFSSCDIYLCLLPNPESLFSVPKCYFYHHSFHGLSGQLRFAFWLYGNVPNLQKAPCYGWHDALIAYSCFER